MRCLKVMAAAIPFAVLLSAGGPGVAGTDVVASIKPVHSLVAAVMAGVGAPGLIVEGAGSPHTMVLAPSKAAALQHADVVFWIGPEVEPFLEKPLTTLAGDARVVPLGELPGLTRLPLREGGDFEALDHDDAPGHDDGDHDAFDGHVWLDPANARTMVTAIADTLSAADPGNEAVYRVNAAATLAWLDALEGDIADTLEPVRDRRFVVFHDGYRYFERRFGLAAAGSITVSPEVIPGAARVAAMRDRIRSLGATCVFAEPQFEPRLVSVVTEGTEARSGVLDPLGAAMEPGPDLYFTLLEAMAHAFVDCLGDGG